MSDGFDRGPAFAQQARRMPQMSGEIHKTEGVLEDDFPVYGDYLYVADGRVIRSDVFGTVRDLKRDTGATEIRRCDMDARGFFD